MVALEHDEILARIRFLKYIIGAFLSMALVVLILSVFSIQTTLDQELIDLEVQQLKEQKHIDSWDVKRFGYGLETISKIMMGAMIIALLCHIFLLWGVVQERLCAVMTCAVLLTVDIFAMMALWQPSSLFLAGFLFDILLAICTYYLGYLLIRKQRTRTARPLPSPPTSMYPSIPSYHPSTPPYTPPYAVV